MVGLPYKVVRVAPFERVVRVGPHYKEARVSASHLQFVTFHALSNATATLVAVVADGSTSERSSSRAKDSRVADSIVVMQRTEVRVLGRVAYV